MLAVGGCAYFDRDGSRDALLARAGTSSWQTERVSAAPFTLFTLARRIAPSRTLSVYLEGDGRAWLDRSTPSADPTPERPVGLRLALADPAPNLLYVGRPCQYPGQSPERRDPACDDARYWTSHRYAPEVVAALSAVIDRKKASSGSTAIELIGYSGGGALAALLAARRTDVQSIVTIAANLDMAAWTRVLGVDALAGSLDPALETGRVSMIPQYHLVGSADETVPPAIVRGYLAHGAGGGAPRIGDEVPGFTHECCWQRDWDRRISDIRMRLGASASAP